MYHTHHQQHLPCLHCHPHSYIRMVHHLIETCLVLRMRRDQCVKALAEHASIKPLVTLTVWRELQKENRSFFQAYFHSVSSRPSPYRWRQRVPRLGGDKGCQDLKEKGNIGSDQKHLNKLAECEQV